MIEVLRLLLSFPFAVISASCEIMASLIAGRRMVFTGQVMRFPSGRYGFVYGVKGRVFDDADSALAALRYESTVAGRQENDRLEREDERVKA